MSVNPNGSLMPRAERYRQVADLREQGHTFKEIGAILGIALTTAQDVYSDPSGDRVRARKAKYAGVCVDCGEPTAYKTGGTAERCRDCSITESRTLESRHAKSDARRGVVRWSDQEIFDAIQSVAVAGVATCTAYDRARLRDGNMPSRPAIILRFGSWRKAVHAADLVLSRENVPEQYASRISDEGLLCAIEDCAEELGHVPGVRDYEKWSVGRAPTATYIRLRFGSWVAALEAAQQFPGDEAA